MVWSSNANVWTLPERKKVETARRSARIEFMEQGMRGSIAEEWHWDNRER